MIRSFVQNRAALISALVLGLLSISFAASAAIIVPPPGPGPDPDPEPVLDADADGVLDEVDQCEGTQADTMSLNPRHHMWDGEVFVTLDPVSGDIVASEYSIEETDGCGCEQILDQLPGKRKGEHKYGCTRGTMNNATR